LACPLTFNSANKFAHGHADNFAVVPHCKPQHASSRTTETIYRHELRPVITTGADVMDKIFTAVQRDG
jgi:hypothetical protein